MNVISNAHVMLVRT